MNAPLWDITLPTQYLKVNKNLTKFRPVAKQLYACIVYVIILLVTYSHIHLILTFNLQLWQLYKFDLH